MHDLDPDDPRFIAGLREAARRLAERERHDPEQERVLLEGGPFGGLECMVPLRARDGASTGLAHVSRRGLVQVTYRRAAGRWVYDRTWFPGGGPDAPGSSR